MTERITPKQVRTLLKRMGSNGKFPVKDTDYDPKGGYFFVGVAYGKPRIHYALKSGGIADVSPRLPSRQLHEWAHTFGAAQFRAFHAHHNKIHRERNRR